MARRPTDPLRSPGVPARGDPDQRALDAIAAAVRRARGTEHLADEPVTAPEPVPAVTEPVTAVAPVPSATSAGRPEISTPATDPGPGSSPPPARPGREVASGDTDLPRRSQGSVPGPGPIGPPPTGTTLHPVADPPRAWATGDLDLDAVPLFDDFALTAFTLDSTAWRAAGPDGAAGPGAGADSPSLGQSPAGRVSPTSPVPRAGRARRRPPAVVSRHAVIMAVMVVAIAVVVAGSLAAALAISSPGPTAPATGSGAGGGHRTVTSHNGSGGPGTGRSTTPTTAHGGTSATPGRGPTSTIAPGGAPHVTAVRPASGGSGQTVTVTGSGLYSGNGVITASVGGAPASTACSSSTSCTVTVPDLGGPRKTTLVVATATGSSNSVPFNYT